MRTQIAITDLTRMQGGRVCVAGYDRYGKCYRPILPPPGISESSLFDNNNKPIIYPFAVVEYGFLFPNPQPPHTEDFGYDTNSVKYIADVKNRNSLLNMSLYKNVEEIFEQPIHDDWGFYVMDKCGSRSIGTIIPKKIVKINYEKDEESKWDYRLFFYDRKDRFFRLKITDLTWHYFCDSLREENKEPIQIAQQLTQLLQKRTVYLRIGLARGWNEYPDRCYLQVNAIHTFPDYLEGKTFVDFKPS